MELAEFNARMLTRDWKAVERKEELVGQSDSIPQAKVADPQKDTAEQHAPVFEIPPTPLR